MCFPPSIGPRLSLSNNFLINTLLTSKYKPIPVSIVTTTPLFAFHHVFEKANGFSWIAAAIKFAFGEAAIAASDSGTENVPMSAQME